MHPISISLKRSREKPAWPMMGREGHVEAPGRRRALLACLCAEGHHVTGARPGTLGKGRRCPRLWQWEGERGGFLTLPSSPPTLTQAVLLALSVPSWGGAPWRREVKLKEAWPLEFRAGGADPYMVPQKPLEPGDLESTLGLEPPCRRTGLQSAKLTHITRCHILHHLGVQPPPQRAPPVCIFLEGVKEGMFIYSIK